MKNDLLMVWLSEEAEQCKKYDYSTQHFKETGWLNPNG